MHLMSLGSTSRVHFVQTTSPTLANSTFGLPARPRAQPTSRSCYKVIGSVEKMTFALCSFALLQATICEICSCVCCETRMSLLSAPLSKCGTVLASCSAIATFLAVADAFECGQPLGPCGEAVPAGVTCPKGAGWCTAGHYWQRPECNRQICPLKSEGRRQSEVHASSQQLWHSRLRVLSQQRRNTSHQ
jgi:hypothetical protein